MTLRYGTYERGGYVHQPRVVGHHRLGAGEQIDGFSQTGAVGLTAFVSN